MAPKGDKCVFMGTPRNFLTGTISVPPLGTRKIVERRAVQWVDGHKKTGGDGTGSDDGVMKSAEDGTIVERGTPQLNVQGLGQEQQLTLHEHKTQEAFSEDEGEKQEAFSEYEGETQGTFSKLEEETQKAVLEHEQEQQQKEREAGLASGRKILRDRPYPRCVGSPPTAISRPYCHHARGVEDLTPVWREQRCIVSFWRSKPRRKTAWRMRWRATTGAK